MKGPCRKLNKVPLYLSLREINVGFIETNPSLPNQSLDLKVLVLIYQPHTEIYFKNLILMVTVPFDIIQVQFYLTPNFEPH